MTSNQRAVAAFAGKLQDRTMSVTNYACIFSADPADVPESFAGPEQISSLLDRVWEEATAAIDHEPRIAHGCMRGTSIFDPVQRLLETLSLTGLSFLHSQAPGEFETEVGLRKVAVLRGAQVDRAAAQLEIAWRRLASDSGFAVDMGEFLDPAQAESAFQRDFRSEACVLNLNQLTQDDEGRGGEYLAAYLACSLGVLEFARRHQRAVVFFCDLEGEVSLRGVDVPAYAEVRLPAQFVAAVAARHDAMAGPFHLDLRLRDGRKFFGIGVTSQGVLVANTDPHGNALLLPFGADDIVDVRPARAGLRSMLGLW
jgi:hypothetical protein